MRVVCYIFIVFLSSSFVQNPNKQALITWRPDYQLTWTDFKGPRQHRDAVASTTYDIVKRVRNANTYARVEITAVFYPYDSWHNKLRNDKIILAHEQKHFDIAELFARKLRKKISAENYANYNELQSRLETLYAANDKEMDRYQDLYDQETDYSREPKKQQEWNEKIQNELVLLSAFSSTVVTLPFNSTSGR